MARRSRPGEPRDAGLALVEFVLVIPIVMVLVFGVIEFAFILRDDVAVTNLTRDASRVASANPRVGGTGALIVAGHKGVLAAGPSFAYKASQAVEVSGSSLPKDSIRRFWVYLANAQGYPTQSSDWKNDSNTLLDDSKCLPAFCVEYRWIDGTPSDPVGGFKYFSGTWDPASINACPRSFDKDAQAVGVYMQIDHTNLYGTLIASRPSLRLADRSVVKFEPMRTDTCR